jgi:hypothetical protein
MPFEVGRNPAVRVDRQLGAEEEEGAGFDGLRLVAKGLRRCGGLDRLNRQW